MELLAFILSTLGTVCICIAPLLKGKKMGLTLLCVFSANILVASSYLLTGALTGAASCFVGGAQAIVNFFFDRKKKPLPKWLVAIYGLSFVVVNLLVFKGWTDLIAMAASLLFILCIGQKNGKKYRRWTFANTALWLTYDVVNLSYGPMTTHGIQLMFVISGMLMHDIRKK